jgi:hypothetical protein
VYPAREDTDLVSMRPKGDVAALLFGFPSYFPFVSFSEFCVCVKYVYQRAVGHGKRIDSNVSRDHSAGANQ